MSRKLVVRFAAPAGVLLTLAAACADSPTQSDPRREPDLAPGGPVQHVPDASRSLTQRASAVNATDYIDANDLPFTEEELYRGFVLLGSEQEAREGARLLAETLGGGDYEGGWFISDEAFAAIALVSDDLRERVDAYMRTGWEGRRRSVIRDALRREGLPSGSEPTASALRAADDEIARYVAQWRSGCAALAEWVRRRQAGEPVGDEPPPWPGDDEQ
ncbi:MAG TPA: hypothetical protein VK358_13185 [Longimicrobium sp.]|nr:hypothetical protein [Longimicrobium sp.]